MSRVVTSPLFRRRLELVIARSHLSLAAFARAAGVDRSTLAQLLSDQGPRLPRAETLVAIASSQRVSVDWLLGLSQREEIGAELIEALLQIEPHERTPLDDQFVLWLREVEGLRVRTVPVSIPDFLKTGEVLRFEYPATFADSAPEAVAAVRARVAALADPEGAVEAAVSLQALDALARAQGPWEGLPADVRRRQLDHMAGLYEATYPGLRLYLYDLRDIYSVPFTVFGGRRSVIFLGASYLVLNGLDHIRLFSRRFDDLIRLASVQPHAVAAHIRGLAAAVAGDA